MLSYYERHKEEKKAYQREYYRKNKSKILARGKRNAQRYPEKERARCRKYRQKHPEKLTQYRIAHPLMMRKHRRNYYLKNQTIIRITHYLGLPIRITRKLLAQAMFNTMIKKLIPYAGAERAPLGSKQQRAKPKRNARERETDNPDINSGPEIFYGRILQELIEVNRELDTLTRRKKLLVTHLELIRNKG